MNATHTQGEPAMQQNNYRIFIPKGHSKGQPMSARYHATIVSVAILAVMLTTRSASAATPAEQKADELIREKTKDTPVQAGFFSLFKEESGGQWEPWIVYHKGRYYNFTDAHGRNEKGDPLLWAIHALGVSDDGVYWKEYGRLQTVYQLTPGAKNGGAYQVYRLHEEGPWVMFYSAANFPDPETGKIMLKFRPHLAQSDDLLHWTPMNIWLSPTTNYYDAKERWDSLIIQPHPEGGYFAVMDAGFDYKKLPRKEGRPVAAARSKDGLHWEGVEPLRILDPDNMCSIMEIGGLQKVGGKWIITSNCATGAGQGNRAYIADQMMGPYRVTERCDPMDPVGVYGTANTLNNDVLFAGFLRKQFAKKHQGSYRTLLKELRCDGNNVWLGWWRNNERLKARPMALSALPAEPGLAAVIHPDEKMTSGEVLVMEGTVEGLDQLAVPKVNDWAIGAKAVVEPAELDKSGTSKRLTDGKPSTAFQSSIKGTTGSLTLDFGQPRPIGRLRLAWQWLAKVPDASAEQIAVSDDGTNWRPVKFPKRREPRPDLFLSTQLGPINESARYLRYSWSFPTEANLSIADLNVYDTPEEHLGDRPGIIFEMADGSAEALVVNPDGTTRHGGCDADGKNFVLYDVERSPILGTERPLRFRVVQFDDLIEVYLNDCFVQNLVLPKLPSGRIGLVTAGGKNLIKDVKAWYADYELAKKMPLPQ